MHPRPTTCEHHNLNLPSLKSCAIMQCFWIYLCTCWSLVSLPPMRAQEDPNEVYLWWEHKEHGHHDLIARLKKYSASLIQNRRKREYSTVAVAEGGVGSNPLPEAFERTNTHAFVIHGPHPLRAENVRNFSRELGFSESGGQHLTKIYTTLGRLTMKQRKELWANGTAKYHQGNKWVGRYMTVKAHMKALQAFLNTNYSNAIIFEDDVMKTAPFFWPEVHALMADMLQLPPSSWDLQYLGSCYSEPFDFHWRDDVLVSHPSDQHVYFRALNAFCLHAMVYSRTAAEVFLTQWMPFREAVDTILSELICTFGLKAIRPAVPILHQDRTLSKSSARNRDPLFVFKHKKNYFKWHACYRMYNATKAAQFGLQGAAVPFIEVKMKDGQNRGWRMATDETSSPQ